MVACALVIAAFAVYAPSLQNGFVWDDTALVLRDPLIRSWRLIPEGFRHFLFTDATASNFFRPMQRLTFTLEYALWGFSPLHYHLTNILLHAFASIALFGFLAELTKKRLLAAIVAAVWVIHPINSSAVVYVAGRADLLAALFGFSGLWLGLRERERGQTLYSAAAACCMLLAILSKESGFSFLLIWVVIRLWKRRPLLRWLVLLLGVVCAYLTLRLSAEGIEPPRFTEPAPLVARPILMARAGALYTGLFLFPANLSMERDLLALQPSTSVEQARNLELMTLAGIAVIGCFLVWIRRTRDPLVALSLVCAWIAYLPISNLFPLNSTFAEHWFYIPGAFLLCAAGLAGASRLGNLSLKRRAFCLAVLACWVGLLGVRTFVRNADWKDARTFFTSTLNSGGATSRMWTNLGVIELKEGRPEQALNRFQKALESPQPFALLGIANAEIALGNYQGARVHLRQAFQNQFVRPDALVEMAVLQLKESGKDPIALLWEAASLAPENWGIQRKYISRLAERGQAGAAIGELRTLLETQWWRGESWRLLGDLLAKDGSKQEAVSAYQRARELDVRAVLPIQ